MRRATVRTSAMAVSVAVIAATAFVPAITGGWIYDDHPLIEQNPYVHSFNWFTRWFTTDFWDVNEEIVRFGGRMIYWRPLVTASYATDWQLGDGSPVFFHLTNTLYHAIVATLAFVILHRWIGRAWPAALAAMLFAIHPTKAESVAWIAGRTDVLCMLFIFIATLGIDRRLRRARGGIALEVIGTIGAYLSKEQAIVLPAFAAVSAWVAEGRPAVDLSTTKRIIRVALPQAFVAAGYLLIRALVLPISAASTHTPLGFGDHSLAVLETMGRFLTLTFAPHDLSIQHALVYSQQGKFLFSVPYVVIGAIGVIVLVGVAVVMRRRLPVVTVGISFYLFTLLPTSNVRYTEMATLVSERFLYLPVLGIALIVGTVLARVNARIARAAYALTAACVISLGALAMSRSADYNNEREFWARELRLHWNSREAHNAILKFQIDDKRFISALHTLHALKRIHDNYDRRGAWDLAIAYQTAHVARYLIADRDQGALRALDEFCKDLLEHTKPVASLDLRGLMLRVPMDGQSYPRHLKDYAAQLTALRADVNSRMANDMEAVRLAKQALGQCRRCVTVVVLAAVVFARAGDYDSAFGTLEAVAHNMPDRPIRGVRETLTKAHRARGMAAVAPTGPAELQARATELATLEAWGRAYEVLAPYRDQIKGAPRFALGFAELAFRAGQTDVAREVLATQVARDQIPDQLLEWGRNMGWTE